MSSTPLKKFQPENLKNNMIKCIKIDLLGICYLVNPVGNLSEEEMGAEFLNDSGRIQKPSDFSG